MLLDSSDGMTVQKSLKRAILLQAHLVNTNHALHNLPTVAVACTSAPGVCLDWLPQTTNHLTWSSHACGLLWWVRGSTRHRHTSSTRHLLPRRDITVAHCILSMHLAWLDALPEPYTQQQAMDRTYCVWSICSIPARFR
jgi:hypothetical protein